MPEGKLAAHFRFGVSSKNSDVDNLCKTTLDSLATKYDFNDKLVYEVHLWKEDVKKGEEFIEFMLYPA